MSTNNINKQKPADPNKSADDNALKNIQQNEELAKPNSFLSFLHSHWYVVIFFLLVWMLFVFILGTHDFINGSHILNSAHGTIEVVISGFILFCFGYSIYKLHLLQVNLFQRLMISSVLLIIHCSVILYFSYLNQKYNNGDAMAMVCMSPLALFPIIALNLMGGRAGICTAILVSILFPLQISIPGNQIQAFYFALIITILGLATFQHARRRQDFLLSGIVLSAIVFFSAILYEIDIHGNISLAFDQENIFAKFLLFAVCNGLGTGIVCLVLLPLFETLFNVMTPITLLELSDSNSPILRRLQIEAPGTYQHSQNVCLIAESAAYAIHANVLLVKTMALYHDIGKLCAPKYFAENQQNGINPHDDMDPEESCNVLREHIDFGIQLANKYHLGKLIRPAIEQHHGNTLMTFFYNKAKQQAKDKNLPEPDEKNFRYRGLTPSTKEIVIISLADACEAAVRSMQNSKANIMNRINDVVAHVARELDNGKQIDTNEMAQKISDELKQQNSSEISKPELCALINKIIDGRWSDRQLDMSNITTQELAKIRSSFIKTFMDMYHFRPEYPHNESESQK